MTVSSDTSTTGASISAANLVRRLAVPVYAPIVLSTVGTGMLIPVLPLYLTDVGLSLGSASLVLAAVGLGSMIGSVPAGELLGRLGERSALIVALVVLAAVTAPIGLTDAVVLLAALRIAFGMAGATIRLSRQTFVTRRVPASRRGRALAFIGGSFRLAAFVGPFLGGALVDLIGFRWTFVVAALIGLSGLGPAVVSDRLAPPLLASVEAAETQRIGMTTSLRRHWRRLLLGGSAPLLVMTAREGRFIVLPLIADRLDMTATQIGAIVTVSTAADLLLFPVAGSIMDRFGRLHATVPAFTLVAVGLVLLGLAGDATSVLVAGIVMGVGNGLGAGTMMTLGSDLAPADAAGPFLAGMAVMQGLGRMSGALVVGVVGDALGLHAAAYALAVALVVAVLWLVAVVGDSSSRATIKRARLRDGVAH